VKKLFGSSILSIALIAIGLVTMFGGTALAFQHVPWISPAILVTESFNLPLVISSDFLEARAISTEVPTLAGVTLTNPSPEGAPGYSAIVVQFGIHGLGIDCEDVTLEYQVGDNWTELVLTDDGDVLIGTFGPPEGFAVPTGYEETTNLRAIFHTAGVYFASAVAEEVV
jgi:hypothetical protein